MPTRLLTPSEAKLLLIQHLQQDAQAHDDCQFHRIGLGADIFPAVNEAEDEEGYLQFLQALNFWDFWQDARNHSYWDRWPQSGFQESAYYPGMTQADRPVFARRICRSLEENLEMDTDIQKAISYQTRHSPFWERLFKKEKRT